MIPRQKNKLVLIFKICLLLLPLITWSFFLLDFKVMSENEKITLWIHAPTIVKCGENFELTVESWDRYERLAGGYEGEITFDIESYDLTNLNPIKSTTWNKPNDYKFTSNFLSQGIVPAYKIKGADNGKKTFNGITIGTEGIHYIKVIEKKTGNVYRSNPIVVKKKIKERIYWGDIHAHTLMSDGSGLITEAYEFARDVALLDFAALTDHSEHFTYVGDLDLFNMFSNYIQKTNQFNQPGTFVTLVSTEWTPNYVVRGENTATGHLNFYFKGDTMPYFSTFTHHTPDELYAFLKNDSRYEFLAWGHHTLRRDYPSDFAFYDKEINTLIEIYSVHGSCENIEGQKFYDQLSSLPNGSRGYSVRDALRMGRKFGIIASGDSHDGRPGHSISHTEAEAYNQYPYTLSGYRLGHDYPNGLAAIIASELERTSIFDALKLRSCYASTGVNRPFLEFTINGITVGKHDSTVIIPRKNAPRTIHITACADGVSMTPNTITNIKEIQIIKNSEVWKSFKNIDTPIIDITIIDKFPLTGASYDYCIQKEDGQWYINKHSIKPVNPSELNTRGADYYYIRISFTNGGAAWIGPIWVQAS
ncbi:MAG: DUF3604 domain-containing protein [Promethearchaeota archaeon]